MPLRTKVVVTASPWGSASLGARSRALPAEAAKLRGQPGPCPALAAAPCDGRHQALQGPHQLRPIDRPAPALALVGPVAEGSMARWPMAPSASHHLVLQPRRAALQPGDQVLRSRADEPLEPASAPHTGRTAALEDPLATVPGRRASFKHGRPQRAVTGGRRPPPGRTGDGGRTHKQSVRAGGGGRGGRAPPPPTGGRLRRSTTWPS